jgi:hypothetical protein
MASEERSLVMQLRTQMLNNELRSTFEGWYPGRTAVRPSAPAFA